jgi:hypothetical protein
MGTRLKEHLITCVRKEPSTMKLRDTGGGNFSPIFDQASDLVNASGGGIERAQQGSVTG